MKHFFNSKYIAYQVLMILFFGSLLSCASSTKVVNSEFQEPSKEYAAVYGNLEKIYQRFSTERRVVYLIVYNREKNTLSYLSSGSEFLFDPVEEEELVPLMLSSDDRYILRKVTKNNRPFVYELEAGTYEFWGYATFETFLRSYQIRSYYWAKDKKINWNRVKKLSEDWEGDSPGLKSKYELSNKLTDYLKSLPHHSITIKPNQIAYIGSWMLKGSSLPIVTDKKAEHDPKIKEFFKNLKTENAEKVIPEFR